MRHIALTGPMYSGKTTLAHALEDRGYLLIDFTSLLKQKLVHALATAGIDRTVAEIQAHKQQYRRLLQEFGDAIQFNKDPRFVEEALAPWVRSGKPPAVFDNVRFDEQYAVLAPQGFGLVRLCIDEITQLERAQQMNPVMSREEIEAWSAHKAERGVSDRWHVFGNVVSVNAHVPAYRTAEYLDELSYAGRR